MEPAKYRPALNAYCKLLNEAKHRLAALDTLLGGKTGLSAGAIHESAYLQLRMLCELIALGCLIAHGDLTARSKLKKTYEASKIIKHLERLHPEFYPRAATQTKAGPDEFDAILRNDGFLTKKELLKLYAKSGAVLHRGSLGGLFSNRKYDADLADLKAWKDKIEVLLGYHAMFMLDDETVVLFVLRNKANNDQVQCVVLETESALALLAGSTD
jgi:hypothetical protein